MSDNASACFDFCFSIFKIATSGMTFSVELHKEYKFSLNSQIKHKMVDLCRHFDSATLFFFYQ